MMTIHLLHLIATPPLIPKRAGDFQAFWYFTMLAVAMSILVAVTAAWALRSLRAMWRNGERLLPMLVLGGVGFFCVLFLSMILTALVGLTNHPTTPPSFQLGGSG
jgi:hypothetical protein